LHQTILHTVADGVIGVNADGSVSFVNHSAERMLISTPNGLVGRNINQLLLPDGNQVDWIAHPLATSLYKHASLCRDTDSLRRENGELFPVSYTASPLDLDDMAFSGWVLVFQDITERKLAERELDRIAHFDNLTGLANRAMFHEYLEKAVSRAERAGRQLALFFIDLDGFKEVNDKHGHHAGDELLQIAAKRLEECVRSGDLVSRLGGDEFTLIVEDTRNEHLEMQAKKILSVIEAPYTLLGNLDARISASIGIACFPLCGNDAYTLIDSADKAMYEVKNSGKNGYRICSLAAS
jgi:diguanylate cyclase (GGDEF)-like protein/PAS domain S-box-containing protein